MSSSYQKGIDNFLKKDAEKYKQIVREYILRVNSMYYSTEFPSTQIAKVVLDKLDMKRSKFAFIHKIIRCILEGWQESGLCEMIATPAASRKVKEIYRFTMDGLNKMKANFLDECIALMENDEDLPPPNVMKKREKIIDDLFLHFTET